MKKMILLLLVIAVGAAFVSAKDLETYERKAMFVFPVQYGDFDRDLCSPARQEYVAAQMNKMFVKEFQRFDFFNVSADKPVEAFLADADAYVRENARDIAASRMEADGKFKEAMVTLDDLLKTLENSYALVPVVEDINEEIKTKMVKDGDEEREVIEGYKYTAHLRFDIYSTKTKEIVRVLKADNATSLMGMLMSGLGNLQAGSGDDEGLSDLEKERENQFRGCIAGIMTVMKKKMRSVPEFQIKAVASTVTAGSIGFDMGKDTGIVMDQRYKAYTFDAEGNRKMTAFAKIRKIDQSYSEAQVLIGRSEEGDQIVEDPKLGVNIYAGMGFAPYKFEEADEELVKGQHLAFLVGAEYNLAQFINISEFYLAVNARFSSPKFETIGGDDWNDYYAISVSTVDAGFLKKFYLSRFAITAGIYGTYSSFSMTDEADDPWDEIKGSSLGLTLRGGAEMLITPELYAFGNVTLDMVGTPSEWDIDGETSTVYENIEVNPSGAGLTFGIGYSF